MTLRKITIDNSVRYIPKNEQTKSKKQSDKNQQQEANHTRENKTKIFQKIIKNSL